IRDVPDRWARQMTQLLSSTFAIAWVWDQGGLTAAVDQKLGEAKLLDGAVIMARIARPGRKENERLSAHVAGAMRPIRRDVGGGARLHQDLLDGAIFKLQYEIAAPG